MGDIYTKVWKDCSRSVCSIRFLNGNDIEIVTLTGFKSADYIFTNDLVNHLFKAEFVEITFHREDGFTVAARERLSMHDFAERIITSYDNEITGFAVISIEDLCFDVIPQICLSKDTNPSIGQPVVVIGYQHENPALTIKSGIISTYLHRNHFKYIQFDGSIIWGNSGSPLLDLERCEVIGIIGYQLDRKYRAYEKILEISNNNIKLLEAAIGKLEVEGVDPIQVLIAWEKQIQRLSKEIYKLTPNGIGIAINSKDMLKLLKASGIDTCKRAF